MSRIRWQGKQIMLPGSRGITQGINVNGKPHDLAAASEQLHFKSNWHGPSLGEAREKVMQAPDTHADTQSVFFFFIFLYRVSQRPPLRFPLRPEMDRGRRSWKWNSGCYISCWDNHAPCQMSCVSNTEDCKAWYVVIFMVKRHNTPCFQESYHR